MTKKRRPSREHQSQAGDPRLYCKTFSPEEAMKLLEMSEGTNFRRVHAGLNDTTVCKIARDMKKGNYELNGQTVILRPDGTVLDGQKRMMACVVARVSFRTAVAQGVSDSEAGAVDEGNPRMFNQHLSYLNEDYSNSLASLVRGCINVKERRWHGSGGSTVKMSNHELLRYFESHKSRLRDVVVLARKSCKHAQTGIVGPILFHGVPKTTRPSEHELAQHFVEVLTNGGNKTDPANCLRERIIAAKLNPSKVMERVYARGLYVTVWNKLVKGEACRKLTYRATGPGKEDFPEILVAE